MWCVVSGHTGGHSTLSFITRDYARFLSSVLSVAIVLCSACVVLSVACSAQDAPGPPANYEVVTVDLQNFEGIRLPFNVKTWWRGKVATGVEQIELRLQEHNCKDIASSDPSPWNKSQAAMDVTHFAIPIIEMFRPWQSYCIAITTEMPSRNARVDSSRSYKIVTDSTGRDLLGLAVREYHSVPAVPGSRKTIELVVKPQPGLQNYLSTSIGVAYAPAAKTWIGSTLLHLHLGAINKNTDLEDFSSTWHLFTQRVSLFAGIAPVTVYSNTDIPVENVTAIGNVLGGVAIRSPFYPEMFRGGRARVFLQPLSINVGVLRYAQDHANPLVDEHVVKDSILLGITYDVSIKALLTPIIKLFS